jgi:predicted nucleic acid-binding protein
MWSRPHALPFDSKAARGYGRVYAALLAAGRKPRRDRVVDLYAAATALPRGLPLFTRNRADYSGVLDLIEIVAV